MGVTLHVALGGPQPKRVPTAAYPTIQAAIDAATTPGELILVGPGNYEELVVMWKPVRLQGWGAPVTTINAVKAPAEKLQNWRDKVKNLITTGAVDLLPAQEIIFNADPAVEPVTLFKEEGPGIIVLAKETGPNVFGPNRARIDGFNITGADHAGGIVVNGFARELRISNNRIISNSGFFGGGIRIGHPTLIQETAAGELVYQDGYNDNIRIHNNKITQNGGISGIGGGGVTLCTGSDGYAVADNFICGNFTTGEGAGISHLGRSNNGRIERNVIIFNESFNQGRTVSGGGIFIGGGAPLAGAPNGLSEGSGSVTVNRNLIQGNYAGAGDGGGIRLHRVNGQDMLPGGPDPYTVNIFNNIITNNVAGLAGGGISLEDTTRARIIHNTIARNDSTATASLAFTPGNPNVSNPQPAGIVSRAHSPELAGFIGPDFSNPLMVDNIIWQNRSFYFFSDPFAFPPISELRPIPNPDGTGVPYDDLAVLGTPTQEFLDPNFCILTSLTDGRGGNYNDGTNLASNPLFVRQYFNGNRGQTIVQPEITTAMQAPAAFDEGGNFIKVRFGPLSQTCLVNGTLQACSDYHIRNNSPAEARGINLVGWAILWALYPDLRTDYDREVRTQPLLTRPDIGADERP